jgi:hypothetical protein
VIEGRRATVIGIVKRAYPSASDQRFSLVPRSPRDLEVAGAGPSGASPGPSGGPGASAGPTGPAPGAPGASADAGVPDVALAALAEHVGLVVRVGGLVTGVEPDRIRLDDGTAVAGVVLEGTAADLLPLLQPGDAVNATGTPDERGEVVLVVTDAAEVVLLGDPGSGTGATSPDPLDVAGLIGVDDGPGRGLGDGALARGAGAPALGAPALAIATVLLTAGIAGGLAAHRTLRTRRLERDRIRARLDAIGAVPAAPPGGPVVP